MRENAYGIHSRAIWFRWHADKPYRTRLRLVRCGLSACHLNPYRTRMDVTCISSQRNPVSPMYISNMSFRLSPNQNNKNNVIVSISLKTSEIADQNKKSTSSESCNESSNLFDRVMTKKLTKYGKYHVKS